MSYQMKFIEDCVALIGLLFLITTAHIYYNNKAQGQHLPLRQIALTALIEVRETASNFFILAGKTLAGINTAQENKSSTVMLTTHEPQSLIVSEVTHPADDTPSDARAVHSLAHHPHKSPHLKSHTKEIIALHKQIDFIKNVVATDTLLSLHEKNTLQELIKECDTKVDHLSHFIKKSLIEFQLPDQAPTEQSLKLYESYVNKKIASIAENVLELTLLFYKNLTGKEHAELQITSTSEIFKTLKKINDELKPFIV